MPWYRTGTVSVTLKSNAVIGTGTAFIANSRVGDAFRGPDGAWYEVTNIASDTAMSISPNYQGATNGAGAYALAPMQGYVKDSADALRALVNQFGTKLAALGTTGNYDVLPVTKGGTGGTDAASARAGLGLGTTGNYDVLPVTKGGTGGTDAASARAGLGLGTTGNYDVLPVTKGGTGGTDAASARVGLGLGSAATESVVTSPADNVSGRLLTVGYMGVGGELVADVSANSVKQGGFYRTYNDPSSPSLTTFCGIHGQRDVARSFDIMFDDYGNKMYFRTCSVSGTYSSWALVYHTGNTTKAADGTLKAI